MSDVHSAPAADAAPAPEVFTHIPAGNEPLTPREAARSLSDARYKRQAEANREAAPDPVEQPTPELAQANADPLEEAPSAEPTEAEPAEELPPIEPPRSWTKEAKDRWNALPREAQEEVARIEQSREREFRRSQNEAAEKLKGLSAKEQAVEKARQEYEAKLPAIVQALQDAQAGQFSDIRTMDDVTRLAQEDPFKYLQWQAHQQKLQAVHHEMTKAEERKAQETQSKWAEHVQKENALFAEKAPEFADKAKAKELTDKAIVKLQDIGFSDQELGELAQGKAKLSVYDHRIQLLILDALKYGDAQKAKAAVVAKPLPPVQRPGVKSAPGAAGAQRIQALEQKISNSTGLSQIRAAAELLRAQRGR